MQFLLVGCQLKLLSKQDYIYCFRFLGQYQKLTITDSLQYQCIHFVIWLVVAIYLSSEHLPRH